ncbi:MAG: hypothetical protein M1338_01875 [Patescibacteria group bacterium]|nr:hypothetical protein [Patescibacteria group bacterium]
MADTNDKDFERCLNDPLIILERIQDNLHKPIKIRRITAKFNFIEDCEIFSLDKNFDDYLRLNKIFSKLDDFEPTLPHPLGHADEYYIVEHTDSESDFQITIVGNCVNFDGFGFLHKGNFNHLTIQQLLGEIIPRSHKEPDQPKHNFADIEKFMTIFEKE